MNENPAEITTVPVADEAAIGLQMFVIFTTAILIVTGAVAMLALIDSWWVLGLAFGIHVIMTTVVALVTFSALGGGRLRPGASTHSQGAGETDVLDLPARARVKPRETYPAAA
jgi:hypothetical protein